MPDTEETREEKGTGKDRQRREREIEEEREEAAEDRAAAHEEETVERSTGEDE